MLLAACSAPTSVPVTTPSPATVATPAEAVATPLETVWPPVPERAAEARVTRVVDGDTIVLGGIPVGKRDSRTAGRHARLIGVDTPEVYGGVECYGRRASDFTKRELSGAGVLVSFDVETTDRFGRALVYVWKPDGTFFNGSLAAEGYALQLTVPPNVRYAELFTRLVSEAREAGRGLWSGCPVPRG